MDIRNTQRPSNDREKWLTDKEICQKDQEVWEKKGIASSCAKAGLAKYLQMLSSGLSQVACKKSCGGNSTQLKSSSCPRGLGKPGDSTGLVSGVMHNQWSVSRKRRGRGVRTIPEKCLDFILYQGEHFGPSLLSAHSKVGQPRHLFALRQLFRAERVGAVRRLEK